MATIAQPTIKAKYASVYDEPATIAKVNNVLYVLYPDGRIEPFEVEMAPFTVVLGDVATAETQAMLREQEQVLQKLGAFRPPTNLDGGVRDAGLARQPSEVARPIG